MTTPSGSFTNLSSNHGGGGGMGGGMNMGNMSNSGAMTPQQVQQAAQSLSTSEYYYLPVSCHHLQLADSLTPADRCQSVSDSY